MNVNVTIFLLVYTYFRLSTYVLESQILKKKQLFFGIFAIISVKKKTKVFLMI